VLNLAMLLLLAVACPSNAQTPETLPPPIAVPKAIASAPAQMQAYQEPLEHTDEVIEMVPIPGGTFLMGSDESDTAAQSDESPKRKIKVAPFWMGKFEITWDQYDTWGEQIDRRRRKMLRRKSTPRDLAVDGIAKPTEPYTDMSFAMGRGDRPAICMTQHAARTFCAWLSAKTGRYYRLPTEAEWEYACRAGTTTAYSFGDNVADLDEHAWFDGNSDDQYHRVGQKKPNPWGLHDMHGNVAEWVLDQYAGYKPLKRALNPLVVPAQLYPRVVRGGGWDHTPTQLRSAARIPSQPEWKDQDPQDPRSIWYHTDALSVGFRVVRPLTVPSAKDRQERWDKSLPIQVDIDEED
ncbi:MAG: SUMF1/EgtB/PvdO family nonheme iron enzyme, partial [Planctomycetota bacterium]